MIIAKTFVHNTLLQILTVLHYFGELIARVWRYGRWNCWFDTVVKECRVEITFLFHSNCLILQCCMYQKIMIPYTLKIYVFLEACASLSFTEKFGFDLKKHWISVHFLAAFWQYTYILADVNINRMPRTVAFHSKKNVRLSYHMLIKPFVSKTLFLGYKVKR